MMWLGVAGWVLGVVLAWGITVNMNKDRSLLFDSPEDICLMAISCMAGGPFIAFFLLHGLEAEPKFMLWPGFVPGKLASRIARLFRRNTYCKHVLEENTRWYEDGDLHYGDFISCKKCGKVFTRVVKSISYDKQN